MWGACARNINPTMSTCIFFARPLELQTPHKCIPPSLGAHLWGAHTRACKFEAFATASRNFIHIYELLVSVAGCRVLARIHPGMGQLQLSTARKRFCWQRVACSLIIADFGGHACMHACMRDSCVLAFCLIVEWK